MRSFQTTTMVPENKALCYTIRIKLFFGGIMQNVESVIGKMIDKQDVCFLSFLDEAGFPSTRAMLNPRKRHHLKEFYLTTNTSSRKVQMLEVNPKACLYFYDRPTYRGVALSGTVEVLHDQKVKDEVWRDMDTIFYESNTDPNYCVLKFTASSARYFQDYHSTDFAL